MCRLKSVSRTAILLWPICQRKILILGGISIFQIQWKSYLGPLRGYHKLAKLLTLQRRYLTWAPKLGYQRLDEGGEGVPVKCSIAHVYNIYMNDFYRGCIYELDNVRFVGKTKECVSHEITIWIKMLMSSLKTYNYTLIKYNHLSVENN